ncbi:MAG: LamG-like jellyroll fold domain-containing protein [Opitutae bacterium]
MRKFALIASFLVASFCFAEEPFRVWTNLDGRKIKARFIEQVQGEVSVQRTDGRTFKIPLDNLSEEDRKYVKSVTFDPTDGLVAWYPFNGNAEDESGNGHHGKVIGATLCKDRKGKNDSAYNFDGVNDYVRIEDNDQMNPVSFTVSCWYYGTKSFSGAGTNVLVVKSFTKHVAPFYQWILCIGGDEYESHTTKYRNGNFIFGVNAMSQGGAQISLHKKNVISVWNHVVGVVDQTLEKAQIYLNGMLAAENNRKYTGFNAFPTDIYIGKHGNLDKTQYHTPGHIDDVRIYNKALSANQIKSLYELER